MKQLVNTQEYHQKGSQILVIDSLEAGMGLYLINNIDKEQRTNEYHQNRQNTEHRIKGSKSILMVIVKFSID